MPATSSSPWWMHILFFLGLTKKCPFGARHPRWTDICACGWREPDEENGWHGGLFSMVGNVELQFCTAEGCLPLAASDSHQFLLTPEEEHLLGSFRIYRSELLDIFEDDKPYHYKVFVQINDGPTEMLMERKQGAAVLATPPHQFINEDEDPVEAEPN